MSVRLEPSEYDGETLCLHCGAGLETGKEYKVCTEGVTHEESCARYVWSEDRLCDACEAEFGEPDDASTGLAVQSDPITDAVKEQGPVVSVAHGELRHVGYEVDADGRERAIYATDWEAPGSFLEPTEQEKP